MKKEHVLYKSRNNISFGKAELFYSEWDNPTCIISDGPYGLGLYPGEPKSVAELPKWYAKHIAAWAEHSLPNTTLWFWCSELGWANVHPVLELHGWNYEECCIWDKGISHIAGNCNSKTIRGVPVVTEVAVRYTRKVKLPFNTEDKFEIKEWLRDEWLRSGLPLYKSNEACGVKNAATRKYLTRCDLWYFPPGKAVEQMAKYCLKHGMKTDIPYFSLDQKNPVSANAWDSLRAKWNHQHGVTNVWSEPPVHGAERIRATGKRGYLHINQKPLSLIERQILLSTDTHDVVWEPFGGLCTAAVAATKHNRVPYAAEVNKEFYNAAIERFIAEKKRNQHLRVVNG